MSLLPPGPVGVGGRVSVTEGTSLRQTRRPQARKKEGILQDSEPWRRSWNYHVVSKPQEGLEVTGDRAGPDNGSHCPEHHRTRNQLLFWDGARVPPVAVFTPK